MTPVPSVSATVVVVTPQNYSATLDLSVPWRYQYNWHPAPSPGVFWTVQLAILFGDPESKAVDKNKEEQQLLLIRLTPTGCILDSETPNCSESCVQAASIFDNTSTLANCMALPLLTNMTAAGTLSKSDEAIAKSYGIGGNRSLALQVDSTLRKCFYAYCQQSPACPKHDLNSSYFNQGLGICQGVENAVLGDIAGIGVRVVI